jgi:hypothetical protein
VNRQPDGITLTADPQPWAYCAHLRLQDLEGAKGPATIEISLLAEHGSMGMVVLERGSTVYQVAPEQSVNATAEPLTVRFEIAAIEEAGDIVFRGWPSEGDGPSRVRVFWVNALLDAAIPAQVEAAVPEAGTPKKRRFWSFR